MQPGHEDERGVSGHPRQSQSPLHHAVGGKLLLSCCSAAAQLLLSSRAKKRSSEMVSLQSSRVMARKGGKKVEVDRILLVSLLPIVLLTYLSRTHHVTVAAGSLCMSWREGE